ncbi:hypothetical protein JTE90_008790 [Oedothorax gibbosus]|uniref:Uncharacterized protein n=1 Tax=Oedothorax gibbosus TaxID=931172 RepID=A0AAV6V7U2_9ARAC|nr:hypothetical protein JTE90_008790 [Oedothorax gibbosus]
MSKSFHFTKKIKALDDKMNSCMKDIANLFNGIDSLNKNTLLKTNQVFTEELFKMFQELSSILSQTPDVAEFILPHFGELRTQNSISAIEDLSLDFVICIENVSTSENITEKIFLQWKKICCQLENYSSVLITNSYTPLQNIYANLNLHLLKTFVSRLQLICFMQSQTSSEVESAVYCIQNNYGIASVWNTVSISCIIKIIEDILLFEGKINTLLHKNHPAYHIHEENILPWIEGSRLILATESPEESPISKLQSPSSRKLFSIENDKIHLIWNWRLALVENRSLVRLQRCLQTDIETTLRTFIDLEKKKLKSGDWKDILHSLPDISFHSEYIQTNTVLQSAFNTVHILEKYLPVLSTTCESFQPFKSSFLHTLETYVVNLVRHLKEISESHNTNCVVYYKYIVLNNAIFLKDRLQCYWDILNFSTCEVPKNNVFHSITHLANDLLESVYSLQYRYISCGLFFDADSNKFDDPKPFFEGERISFCIQMWNLHMKGLLHDLSYFLPQKLAKDLYARILSSSLQHFLARYSHATPSEARTPQVLFDVYSLLLCTSELLRPVCSSVSQFIGKKVDIEEDSLGSSISHIHSSCSFLLSIIVVLNSPISELYKYFKNGFPQTRLSVRTRYEAVAPWLPWIRRDLFSEFCQGQIISNVSMWLAVRACTSWSLPNPVSVIKAFTEHNCTLSILLMMQVATSEGIENNNTFSLCKNKVKLAHYLLEVLICYGNHWHLQDILFPVIEKLNGWKEFDLDSAIKPLPERSWWYSGLIETQKLYYYSVFEEMIPVWYEVSKKYESASALSIFNDFKSSFLNHVECCCEKEPLNSCTDGFELSDEVIIYVCLQKFLECMQRNLASLTQTFKCFLMSLNIHITNYVPEVQLFCQSVSLQILLSSAIDFLKDPEFQNRISKDLQEMVTITETGLEKLLFQKEIFSNEKYARKIKSLLSSINENFNDLKQYLEKHSETMHIKEIKEEILETTVCKILQLQDGKDIILYLLQLLHENESWIQKSLGVPPMLSPDIANSQISSSPLIMHNVDTFGTESREKQPFVHEDQKSCVQATTDSKPQDRSKESFDAGCKQVETKFSNCQTNDFQASMDSKHQDQNKESFDSGCKQVETKFSKFQTNNFQVTSELNLGVKESISSSKFNFNPFKYFDELGENNFSQFVLDKPQFHWESIISHLPILGLTEVNFCTLLSHRWDFRNEGPLTDEEKKCIDELRAAYIKTD